MKRCSEVASERYFMPTYHDQGITANNKRTSPVFGQLSPRLGLLFCDICFLGAPVPGVAGIRHSGAHPEQGQDVLLQHKPGCNYCDQYQVVFHFLTPLI